MELNGKRYWLVGASEGLGAALARRMSAEGAELFLSARGRDGLQSLADDLPGRAHVVPLDVADEASVADAAEKVGDVDGMVYLAAVYWPTGAAEWSAQENIAMADINFTGAMRVLGHVVPQMVARDSGHIVITGSLSGFRGLPGAVGYTASKAGLMALAEAMRADLWRSGVRVQLANPGFIKTRLTDKNNFRMPFLMTPEQAADEMMHLMHDDAAFDRHFPMVFSWLFRLSRFLPNWAYYRLFA